MYWQVDGVGLVQQRGVLRSRSLWDAALSLPKDGLADGVVHVHEGTGPDGAALLLVERTVKRERGGDAGGDDVVGTPWRLTVAADLRETVAAVERFNGVLAASLATLFVLLCAAALAQIAIGLAPLRALQRTLAGVRAGTSPKLDGRFPSEVQPLVDDFNAVLDRNAEVVARARTQAGSLAHAIKTPLAAISQAAAVALERPETGAELARTGRRAGGRCTPPRRLASRTRPSGSRARRSGRKGASAAGHPWLAARTRTGPCGTRHCFAVPADGT